LKREQTKRGRKEKVPAARITKEKGFVRKPWSGG